LQTLSNQPIIEGVLNKTAKPNDKANLNPVKSGQLNPQEKTTGNKNLKIQEIRAVRLWADKGAVKNNDFVPP
jgi:hypothetical protein